MKYYKNYSSNLFSMALCLLFQINNIYAQAPKKMSYQAVIRNAQQQVVVNALVKIRLSILRGSPAGETAYSELHNLNTNSNGLVTLQIGSGSILNGSFEKISWATGEYFIKTEVDINNVNNYVLVGTVQLLSVPYALHSNEVTINKSGDTILIGNLQLYIPGVKSFVNGVPAVIIQGQVWMDRNLEVTRYRNGDLIPEITDQTQWAALTTGAWSYRSNNVNLGNDYGKLYNWYAITDTRGLCPVGWRMPSKYDFEVLIQNLGGDSLSAPKLMETGTTYWVSGSGTNSSGFSARGGGWRGGDGIFYYSVRDIGSWWTTSRVTGNTPGDINYPWFMYINGTGKPVAKFARDPYFSINAGVSVRCIKD